METYKCLVLRWNELEKQEVEVVEEEEVVLMKEQEKNEESWIV